MLVNFKDLNVVQQAEAFLFVRRVVARNGKETKLPFKCNSVISDNGFTDYSKLVKEREENPDDLTHYEFAMLDSQNKIVGVAGFHTSNTHDIVMAYGPWFGTLDRNNPYVCGKSIPDLYKMVYDSADIVVSYLTIGEINKAEAERTGRGESVNYNGWIESVASSMGREIEVIKVEQIFDTRRTISKGHKSNK